MSKVDRIMLKFRPIAPKPMTSGSGSSTVENNGGNRRHKRKYVRVNGNKTKKNTNTVSKRNVSVSDGGDTAVTLPLPLMPETPDRKENSPATSENLNKHEPVLLSFNNPLQTDCYGLVLKKTEVISFVTMECVTATWLNDDVVLGLTDQARVINLEVDTCPSFMTNSKDMVVWTNKAYREMTAGGGGGSDDTVVVVVKKYNRVTMPPVSHMAFTCKMKVSWGMESGLSPSTLTVPCDVVQLRSGGYAWRLDVTTALCLGR